MIPSDWRSPFLSNLHALLFNQDTGVRSTAVNVFRSNRSIAFVNFYSFLKLDNGCGLFNTAYILQQGQLKTLCLQIFIVMSLSASGKLFCGGAALSVYHGSVFPIAFLYMIPHPAVFCQGNYKMIWASKG